MKIPKVLLGGPVLALVLVVVFAVQAQQNAAIQLSNQNDIQAGGAIALHIKFNEPLPEGTNVRVEISPQSTTQWIPLSTGEPDNPSRTAFTAKTTLPENAVPGAWAVRNVWLFLPGSVQGQSLGHNNATFQVKGKGFPIPSKAEITVTK